MITGTCPRDSRIRFNEGQHAYYVDWLGDGNYTRNRTSVTGLIKSFFNQFNADAVIKNMRKPNVRGKKKYRGKTNADIKAEWDKNGLEARTAGSLLHKQIEAFYRENKTPPGEPTTEFEQFLCYNSSIYKQFTPFRSEWVVFDDGKSRLAGTIDMVYVTKSVGDTLHVVIVDWKRIKKLSIWARECGTGLCSEIPDANYFRYALQLNLYKHILEKNYDNVSFDGKQYSKIVVDNMWLVVCHPNQKKYSRFQCPNMDKTVTGMLASLN